MRIYNGIKSDVYFTYTCIDLMIIDRLVVFKNFVNNLAITLSNKIVTNNIKI